MKGKMSAPSKMRGEHCPSARIAATVVQSLTALDLAREVAKERKDDNSEEVKGYVGEGA